MWRLLISVPRGSPRPMQLLTVPVGALQCNCYILWERPDQALVIDPGDEGERLAALLEERGLKPALIVSTHGHFDHVGGVDALRNRFGATYRIHEADVPILKLVPAASRLWGIQIPPRPVPKDFIEPGAVYELGGLRVETIHTPGHTPGSTCFHVPKERVVFTGDTLFLQSIGRTDFPGGDHEQILVSIRERLLSLPRETRVLPGHGPGSTIGAEADGNPFLA